MTLLSMTSFYQPLERRARLRRIFQDMLQKLGITLLEQKVHAPDPRQNFGKDQQQHNDGGRDCFPYCTDGAAPELVQEKTQSDQEQEPED